MSLFSYAGYALALVALTVAAALWYTHQDEPTVPPRIGTAYCLTPDGVESCGALYDARDGR